MLLFLHLILIEVLDYNCDLACSLLNVVNNQTNLNNYFITTTRQVTLTVMANLF